MGEHLFSRFPRKLLFEIVTTHLFHILHFLCLIIFLVIGLLPARAGNFTTTAEPIVFTATGNAFGAASVDVTIDGFGKGKADHAGWQGTGDWTKQLRVPPGSHEMTATAQHPSGQFSPDTSHTFTANITQQTVSSAHDASGNVTTRTFSGGRVQTLTWDAQDHLIRVTERDATNDGYDWSAVYDGLGRRIRTTMTDVKADAALPHFLTTESIFDPEVEFLEIAITINGKRTWKIHGPDLDGRFGGLQGIGGLEATIQETGNITTGILTDVFGNGVGIISGTSLTWHPNRVGSYGSLPGHTALTPNASVTVAQATAWRGKSADPTGFYNLGARYYEPNGGRFLSADPMGHSASISLYDYANGDPVNFADPDGRIGKAIGGALGIKSSNHSSGVTYRAPSYGTINNSFTPSQTVSGTALLSAGFNAIPVLGTIKSFIELSSGNDLFTGAQISTSQSAFNVLASAVPFAAGSIGRFGTQAIGTSMGSISGGAMNFGGGMGAKSGGNLIHLTDGAGKAGITASNTLRGSHGIFAVPSKVAAEGTAMKVARTGLTPDKTTHFVNIPQAANSLFTRPVPIGPSSAW